MADTDPAAGLNVSAKSTSAIRRAWERPALRRLAANEAQHGEKPLTSDAGQNSMS
jgi:hypothetical protein